MTDKSMQFLYGDRELLIAVGDIMSSPVEVIVNSTDPDLLLEDSHGQRLVSTAGADMKTELTQLIRHYGKIEPGMVVYTTAGKLPFQAVIHTIDPHHQEGDEQLILEQSISRSLLLCETNDWRSIAFPAIGVAAGSITIEQCAQAFFRAITSFWDARHECVIEKINLCLDSEQLPLFFTAFRNDAIDPVVEDDGLVEAIELTEEETVGVIDLQEEDMDQSDEEVNSWFK
jgi:O-acetyl-ADP-ribose deacetylase (regulator of RNase III)